MENAAFVIERTKLKNSEDWLVTDLGTFENRGSSAHVFLINDDCVVESCFSKGTKTENQQLQTGEYMVRNVFEGNKKYDFNRTSTLIMRWDGEELPLGLIQFTFAEEEHSISPLKHPCLGEQFILTAPSTKAKLLKEASGRKGLCEYLMKFWRMYLTASSLLTCPEIARE